MTLTVIIATHNRLPLLVQAVRSLRRQAADLPLPLDILVVDDGSSDGTAETASGFAGPVRVISQANAGPGAATMTGIAAARMPVLAFLDADDLWLPEKIARQMEHLRLAGPGHLVFARMRQFHHGMADDGKGRIADGLSRSTLLMDRSVLDRIGPIADPPGRRGEMIDWFGRAREAGMALDVLPQVLALRRILPGSLSWGRDAQADSGYLRVAHAAMLRARAKRARE